MVEKQQQLTILMCYYSYLESNENFTLTWWVKKKIFIAPVNSKVLLLCHEYSLKIIYGTELEYKDRRCSFISLICPYVCFLMLLLILYFILSICSDWQTWLWRNTRTTSDGGLAQGMLCLNCSTAINIHLPIIFIAGCFIDNQTFLRCTRI